jgi:hypothetical protein
VFGKLVAVLESPAAAEAGLRCCAVACNLLTAVDEAGFAEGAILDEEARRADLGVLDECTRRLVVADAEAALVARRRIVFSGRQ